MNQRREDIDQQRQRRALRDIERVDEQSEVIGTSQVKRSSDRARDHFMGADGDPEDRVEIWGKRIGRMLSLAFLIGLVVYLMNAYF